MTQQLLWHNFTQIDLIPDGGGIPFIEVVGSAEVANCHLLRISNSAVGRIAKEHFTCKVNLKRTLASLCRNRNCSCWKLRYENK